MQCRRTFLELNPSEPYLSSEGKRKPRRGLFTSSLERETRHFHVVVVQWRQRNVQTKSVMHVQSCCFANRTYCYFYVLVAVVRSQGPLCAWHASARCDGYRESTREKPHIFLSRLPIIHCSPTCAPAARALWRRLTHVRDNTRIPK